MGLIPVLKQSDPCNSYTGFHFNGRHSSEFNIVRVSNSDRYTTDLIPTNQDKSIHVPGQEGSYFFGMEYKQKNIPIDIAYDKLTPALLEEMKSWLSKKTTGFLVLDETPYKAYFAKCDNLQTITYIPFDENGEVHYKGNATLNFICYYPFARSTIKYASDLGGYKQEGKWSNPQWEIDEWQESSGIPDSDSVKIDNTDYIINKGFYNESDSEQNINFEAATGKPNRLRAYSYNPGDIVTYPRIKIKIDTIGVSPIGGFVLEEFRESENSDYSFSKLKVSNFIPKGSNGFTVIIDGRTKQVVELYNSKLYNIRKSVNHFGLNQDNNGNNFFPKGEYFCLPANLTDTENFYRLELYDSMGTRIDSWASAGIRMVDIELDYGYFYL